MILVWKIHMKTIRKEVRELITINEKIQSAFLRGECMTNDEMELIKICATELLTKTSERSQSRFTPNSGFPAEV